jgi:molecular chaperone DnaK
LQDGDIILEAEGEVLWNRKATTPQEPSGMGFRFINLSEASQKFVWRVAHMNLEAGIPPAVILESTDIIIDSATGEEIIPESLFRKSAPTPAVSPIPTPVASMAKNGPQKKSLLTDSVETAVTSVEGGPVIGIDFGTCNSCVAFMDGETSKLIPTDKGGLIIPSVVAFTDKGQIIVGQHAKDQQLINPQATVYAVKRFLGRTFHSPVVRDLAPRFPFKIKPDKNNEILLEFAGHDHALPEIVAMILSYLKECAEGYLQTPIHRAIMTVPAYFTEKQRAALKRAAALAHLKVELVFHEPTAAALAYGYNKEYEKRILVFDLGGGTFDVSILEVNGNVFEVKGTGGDPFLGGLDFDQRLINHIVSEFEKQHKVSVRDNAIVMQRISNAAENAKIQLSFESKANIHLPYIVEKKGKPLDLSMTIERDKLNELVKDLVEKTLAICEHACGPKGESDAGV